MEAAGAKEEEDQSPVHHKTWETERLRALNGALGGELQPEELLLEAVVGSGGTLEGDVLRGVE